MHHQYFLSGQISGSVINSDRVDKFEIVAAAGSADLMRVFMYDPLPVLTILTGI